MGTVVIIIKFKILFLVDEVIQTVIRFAHERDFCG